MLDLDRIYSLIPAVGTNARFILPLGDASNHVWAKGDSPSNFYLLGAMGMALPLGLGVAIGTADPVIAMEGDGGLMMNLGVVWTASKYGPSNLKIITIDNDGYMTTGGQATSFEYGNRIEEIARVAGLEHVRTFESSGREPNLWDWVLEDGLRFAVARVNRIKYSYPIVAMTPHGIAERFRSTSRAGLRLPDVADAVFLVK